ncbi:MAG: DUF5694 domain-containing protein [Phycisphaerales bacterium]
MWPWPRVGSVRDDPDARVLVIVGSGHVPILKHCVQSCPTMEWVEVGAYLEARAPAVRP